MQIDKERERVCVCVLFNFVIFLTRGTRLRISMFGVDLCKISDLRLYYSRTPHLRRSRASESVLVF